MEVTSDKMDKFTDHGPNIKKVRFLRSLKDKNKDYFLHKKRIKLIHELTKYDDWFNQLVNFNSYEVTEKMDHLLDQISIEILSDKCFKLLLKQVQQWYIRLMVTKNL